MFKRILSLILCLCLLTGMGFASEGEIAEEADESTIDSIEPELPSEVTVEEFASENILSETEESSGTMNDAENSETHAESQELDDGVTEDSADDEIGAEPVSGMDEIESVSDVFEEIAQSPALDGDTTSVQYVDANGYICDANNVTIIDSNYKSTSLSEGWYVVEGSVTCNKTLSIDGNVNLILADGSNLTVNSTESKCAGIKISGAYTFTIFGQTSGNGTLNANGGNFAAGIGGAWPAGAKIIINGGIISANGGYGGAGIGGNYGYYFADTSNAVTMSVTINGGVVSAIAGDTPSEASYAAASCIGGGGGDWTDSGLKISTSLAVYYGSSNPPTDKLSNSGGDLAKSVKFKRYLIIKEPVVSVTQNNRVRWYSSFSDAWYNADGATLNLLQDLSISSTYSTSNNFTINMNGKKLTMSGSGSLVNNGGSITITGGGTITGATESAFCNKTGTLNLQNLTISGNSSTNGGAVYNSGTMNMSGGTISGNSATNGGGIYNTGTLTLTGGSVTGNTASGLGGGIYNAGTLNLGGSASVLGNTLSVDSTSNNIYLTDGKYLTLNNPTSVSVGISTEKIPCQITTNGSEAQKSIFSVDKNDGSQIVYENSHFVLTCPYLLTCGETTEGYSAFDEAWAKAKTLSSTSVTATLKLNKNADLSDLLSLDATDNICLDLNGYTMTGVGSDSVIKNSGILKLTDSSSDQTGKITGGSAVKGGGIYNAGTLTLLGGSITGNKASTAGGGVYCEVSGTVILGGTVKVTDNTLTGDDTANNLYIPTGGYVTVGSSENVPVKGMKVGISLESVKGTFTTTDAVSGQEAYFSSDKAGYAVLITSENRLEIAEILASVTISGTSTNYSTFLGAWSAAQNGTEDAPATLVMLADVNITAACVNAAVMTLDLNGHTLRGDGSDSVVKNTGTLTLINGTDNSEGVVTGGIASMGGGIYNTGKLTVTGGKITGNKSDFGGGIYNNGTLTLGGTVRITGNTDNSGAENNVYLPENKLINISSETIPTSDMTVGVTLEDAPMVGVDVAFTSNGQEGDIWYFQSDSELCRVKYTSSALVLESLYSVVPIAYVDEGGNTQQCTDYLIISADMTKLGMSDRTAWYVAEGTVSTEGLTIEGNVHLILKDSCNLTVQGGNNVAGISVSQDASLTIYAQSEGSGILTATGGGTDGAGIEVQYNSNGLTVNGGIINATGAVNGAGIGGNKGQSNRKILINGGAVTASGATGIGGGYNGGGSDITINGGVVTATGLNGAGIGGGYGSLAWDIAINGGIVTAKGTNGAGIGKGAENNGSAENIRVKDNLVLRAGTSADALELISHTNGDCASLLSENCGYVSITPAVIVTLGGKIGLYDTFSEAWAAAQLCPVGSSAEVKLYADQTCDHSVENTKNVVLDLNGFVLSYTGDETTAFIKNYGELTIKSSDDCEHKCNTDDSIWVLDDEEGNTTVTGGCITGASGTKGGAIYSIGQGAKLTLASGNIVGNSATIDGGGVYIGAGSKLIVSGGSICGNGAENNGGAVYIANKGSFSMTGGSIIGNSSDNNGGGVYVSAGSSFLITAGSINGNEALTCGSGVYDSGTMTVGGTAVISGNKISGTESENNLYLPAGKYISVSSASEPVTGMNIGISSGDVADVASIVKIVENAQNGQKIYFSSDAGYGIRYQNEGDNGYIGMFTPFVVTSQGKSTGYASFEEAWSSVQELGKNESVTLKLNADVKLSDDLTADEPLNTLIVDEGYSVVLDLNGCVLEGCGIRRVIENYGELTICDSDPDVKYKFSNQNGLWVRDDENGKKTVTGGIITGGKEVITDGISNGGGIYNNEGATLTIEGGTVVGNAGKKGGGIFNAGTLTMTGGVVEGNTATVTGGGVQFNDGTVTLGGTVKIYDNVLVSEDNITSNNLYLARDKYLIVGQGTTAPATSMSVYVSVFAQSGKFSAGGKHEMGTADCFGSDLDSYGCVYNEENSYLELVKMETSVIASVTMDGVTRNYYSFATAWNAAQKGTDEEPATLTLCEDVVCSTTLINEAVMTLVPNEYTLSLKTGTLGSLIANSGILTVKGGKYTGGSAENGGVFRNDGKLELIDCTFNENAATENGGAVYSTGTLILTDCVFNKNTANNGGAVYIDGNAEMGGCSFEENTANNNGGAVYNAGTFDAVQCKCIMNSAEKGGAIYSADIGNIAKGEFTENTASLGGGIYNAGKMSLNVCISTGDTATANGGAVYNAVRGNLEIIRSQYTDCSATSGGAVHNTGNLIIVGAEVTKNTAMLGGGVYNGGTMEIGGNVVIYENTDGNSRNNLYLAGGKRFSISTEYPLTDYAASVGIRTAVLPTESSPVRISENGTDDDGLHFSSDDRSFGVTGSVGRLTLQCLNSVDYMESGATKQTNEYEVLSSVTATMGSAGMTTWYIVSGNLTREAISAVGDVRLILTEESSLTVNGGIQVDGEESSLTIYAQSTGSDMGVLVANGDETNAGISGNVIIQGGKVTVSGGTNAGGIDGTSVSIVSGNVTATGGVAGIRADSIFVGTKMILSAGSDVSSTSTISNDGSNLSAALGGMKYVSVQQPENLVGYLDYEGMTQYCVVNGYISSSSQLSSLTEGWYLVSGNVDVDGELPVSGNVNLILANGCAMTVKGTRGITPTDDNSSLHVYVQSSDKDAGKLRIYGAVSIQVDTESASDAIVISGDADGNGSVVAIDLIMTMKYILGEEPDIDEEAVNMNGDSIINLLDLVLILKVLMGV